MLMYISMMVRAGEGMILSATSLNITEPQVIQQKSQQ